MSRVRDARLTRLATERTRFGATAKLGDCTPRAWNTVCATVRDGLVQAGINPACAATLQRSSAAAELAELDVLVELHRSETQLTEGDHDGLAEIFAEKIGDVARRFEDGHEPDFASASLAELFAWCLWRRGSCGA